MKTTSPFITLAAAALVAVFGGNAHAQLYWSGNGSSIGGSGTWGTTNARFGTATNGPFSTTWNNTANASNQAFFQTTRGTVTVQDGGISVGTITPLNATATNPWVFTGGNITLGSRLGAFDNSAVNASFSNNIALPNATTFFYRGGNSTLNISGQLSGAGKVTNDRGNSTHILTLTGNNSGWSGGMTMTAMNFVLGHNSALGTGIVEASGSPVISATTPLTAINTPFLHGATGAATSVELITLSGSNAMTFNGNLSWSGEGTGGLTRGFDVTSTNVMTWNGVISQTSTNRVRNFRKSGSGTLVLGGANTYGLTTGTTTVAEGTLLVNNTTGSATGQTAVVVSNNATLGGTGTIAGTVAVSGTLSPGNSPGTLNTGSQTWLDGGDYNFQIYDANGSAGTGYDTINITGGLNLSSLTANGFNINLWSLSSISPDVNGDAINFNNANNYSWTLVSTTTGITGFSAGDFAINTSATNGTGGFSNTLNGSFSVDVVGNDLLLSYIAIPEPSTWALLAVSLSTLAIFRRRRRH